MIKMYPTKERLNFFRNAFSKIPNDKHICIITNESKEPIENEKDLINIIETLKTYPQKGIFGILSCDFYFKWIVFCPREFSNFEEALGMDLEFFMVTEDSKINYI